MSDLTPSDNELTHYLNVILRRRWIVLAATLIIFVLVALLTFTTTPVYRASTLLVIEKERTSISDNSALIENSNEDYYQTQYKLLQSRTLLAKVYDELRLSETADFKDKRGLEKLEEAITISPVLRSRLVYVRADSRDPKTAAAIANRLSESFVEQNLANQLFISKEVLEALQSKTSDASYDSLPAVVNNPLIQTLKGEYAKLQSSHAELAERYTPKHPALAQVRSNMAALRAQIEVETSRIVSSMKTELSGQLKGNNVRIIDPAISPEKPFRPKKLANLILGLLSGLTLGLGFGFLAEILDQTVRTQEDVEKKLRQPFLGSVPQIVLQRGSIYSSLLAPELSLTSEAFRNLRTMVDFAGMDGKSKALLVTSSVQGEGKTYVAANLAVALSQLGESVLLIDGDLRRPNIHRAFGVSAEKGLSEFLLSARSADEAGMFIQKHEVPGLSILPCGPRPPNPSELLNTPRVGGLIAWARQHYDRIIVDCTPMFPVNDTLLWGRHIKHAVFVVRYGMIRTPLISTACQKLSTGGVELLGAAVNAAKAGGLSYAPYAYYYQQYYQEKAGDRS